MGISLNNNDKIAILSYLNLNIRAFLQQKIKQDSFFIIDINDSLNDGLDKNHNINNKDIFNYIIKTLQEYKILFTVSYDHNHSYFIITDKDYNVIKMLSNECSKIRNNNI